jgi:hypothetical protein
LYTFIKYIDRLDTTTNPPTRVDPNVGAELKTRGLLNPHAGQTDPDGRMKLFSQKTATDPARINVLRNFFTDSKEGQRYHRALRQIMGEEKVTLAKAMEEYYSNPTNKPYPLVGWGKKGKKGKPSKASPTGKKSVSKNKLIEIAKILKNYS